MFILKKFVDKMKLELPNFDRCKISQNQDE